MSKAKIIDKKCVDSILGEQSLLTELHHPFIVNMIYSFQDHDYLYLVMDLLPGGNLRYHIGIKNRFNEKQIKFLIGCIMIGLKYIHGQNILHRDIKPENLVFDKNGYLRITDFGIAKHYVVNNKKDTSGTVGYLAPEVLCNVNHNFCIDYYAVGIITYELMYGHRPYLGKTKHEVKQLILTRQAEIDYDDLPDGFSNETADFINRLIQRKPKNRLGKDNINEVLDHPWFNKFDWENVLLKKLKAPYVPKLGDNFDKKYCLQSNKIGTETMDRYKTIMKEDNYDKIFLDFNCKKIPEELIVHNNTKKSNDTIYQANNNNNITSNISTTISRNNKNDNKDNNLINQIQNNLVNKNKLNSQYINDNGNNNNNNLMIKNKDIKINNNNDNLIQKQKSTIENIGQIFNKSSINLFRAKDFYSKANSSKMSKNNSNTNSNLNTKALKQDNININKNVKDIIYNDYLDISGLINKNNNFDNGEDNVIFNKNKLIDNIYEKELNPSVSMSNLNLNNKKKLLYNSTIEDDHHSIVTMNSGILKNMKHQYKELYPNKKNKFLNYTSKNVLRVPKNDIVEMNNNLNNINNNISNNLSNNIYNTKGNKNIFSINSNNILKRNSCISMPKTKKEFIRNEILKTTQMPKNSSINKKSSSQLLMSSTIYKKKKTNSSSNSLINNSKRLSSSHSMHNLKAGLNNNINLEMSRQNKHLGGSINSQRSSNNIPIINKQLPFINIYLNKKKTGSNIGDDIYYISYGKFGNDKIKFHKNPNGNYDYFTDRVRQKKMKNSSNRINYNSKSINNFFEGYRNNMK